MDRINLGPISWESPFPASLAGRILRNDTAALEAGKAKLRAEEGIDDKYGTLTRARGPDSFLSILFPGNNALYS
jgi:hypothetical protein